MGRSGMVREQGAATGRRAAVVLGVYWLALVLAVHWPTELTPDIGFSIWDKLAHFALYGLFTVLVAWWMLAGYLARPRPTMGGVARRAAAAALVVVVHAGLDEWTQPLTHRDGDVADWIADLLGAVAAAALVTLIAALWMRGSAKTTSATSETA